jgi:hypothetical protein
VTNLTWLFVRLPNQKIKSSFVKMLLLLLLCVCVETSGTKKRKKKTAKLLIFKCTQWLNLSWLPPISPKLRLLYDLQTLNDVETRNHYAIRVKVVQQFVFIIIIIIILFFLGGGGCIIFIWSRMKRNGSWSWVLIRNPPSSRRERERADERTKEGSQR